MAYFSQTKGETDRKPEIRVDSPMAGRSLTDSGSTLGRGMLITGNITCVGAVQILGRVIGDIHATSLLIGEGAQVEGNVVAQETVIDGNFKGTIHANNVKLQATAVVDGEIYNKALIIEQNAQFEGIARRLDKAVDAPTGELSRSEQIRNERPAAEVVPISGAIS
jgi:cytoskeletal protein CcmA (bactofilin family)